nr:hypothetical protein [Candidatus Frankia nodulisporulans]
MSLAPRAVLVHRRTEYTELIARHGTRGQAEFFLRTRGRELAPVQAADEATRAARQAVTAAIPAHWRRGEVERADLDRFLFAPDDVVICVGQDGLVANVAKYLDGQPVLGINADVGRNPGVLVRHPPAAAGGMLRALTGEDAARPGGSARDLTMVEAHSDDGQRILALNEVYVGDPGHQTARYVLRVPAAAATEAAAGLVPFGLGAAWRRDRPAGADGGRAGLVRPRGVALARDGHRPHTGRADRGGPARGPGRIGSDGRVRRRHRIGRDRALLGAAAHRRCGAAPPVPAVIRSAAAAYPAGGTGADLATGASDGACRGRAGGGPAPSAGHRVTGHTRKRSMALRTRRFACAKLIFPST